MRVEQARKRQLRADVKAGAKAVRAAARQARTGKPAWSRKSAGTDSSSPAADGFGLLPPVGARSDAPSDGGVGDGGVALVAVELAAPGKPDEPELSALQDCLRRLRRSVRLVSGADADEDEDGDDGPRAQPRPLERAIHLISIPWKLYAALLVPPPGLGAGGPAFVMSLALIGLTTALISDLAGILRWWWASLTRSPRSRSSRWAPRCPTRSPR